MEIGSIGLTETVMKYLILLPLLLTIVLPQQNPPAPQGDSQVAVLGFKWSKTRHTFEKLDSASNPGPAAAMIPANKNYQRNVRINDPAGTRDPNLDTVDGRSAAMEKIVQESRTPPAKSVDGFAYRVKLQNVSLKPIEIIFWEYQFINPADPKVTARRQFLCAVNIKPEKTFEIKAFSLSGPSDVVTVESLAGNKDGLFKENVVINRVEYQNGAIWQRKDWDFSEIKLTYQRAVATPWGTEMCRGL
jgi:hypothetical protein